MKSLKVKLPTMNKAAYLRLHAALLKYAAIVDSRHVFPSPQYETVAQVIQMVEREIARIEEANSTSPPAFVEPVDNKGVTIV